MGGTGTRRRRALSIMAAALLTALAACGTGATTAPPSAAISGDGVDDGTTMTLWTRAPVEQQAKLLVEAYNASHRNKVELTVVPNDDYVAKVGAAAGAGGLPDLLAADIVYVPSWVEQGLFQDISANIDALPFKGEINKGHLAAGTSADKPHVLPFVLDLSMVFWNKTLFAEAGLDPEKGPATLAEYVAAAKAVQALDRPGVYGTATGLACGGCLVFTWFPSVWAAGAQVLDEEGRTSLMASPQAEAIYSAWRDMWESGAVLPSSRDESGPTWTAGFTEGNVGLMVYPATLLTSTVENVDVGVAGVPGPEGGASTFVGGDGIGISKDTAKSPQAWNFLSWLMSEQAQVEVLAKNNDVVSRSDLAGNAYAAQDPRLVTINQVAASGVTPVAANFQQAFNATNSPWLTLVRSAVLGDGADLSGLNDEITAVLGQ